MLFRDDAPFHPPPPTELGFRPRSMPYPERRPLPRRRRNLIVHVDRARHDEVDDDRRSAPDPQKWLLQLYRLCADGKRGPAVDLVLYTFDDLLFLRQKERCDEILRTADVDRLMIEVLLALLMETFRARSVLDERQAFFDRVEARLRRERAERAEAMLRGLR